MPAENPGPGESLPADAAGGSGERRQGRAARMADRLEERRERHLARNKLYRAVVAVAGFLVVLAGIGLSAPGVPGPGFLLIAFGLALLALEFKWAERLLHRALGYADRTAERAAAVSTRRKVTVGIVTAAAVVAAITAVIVFEIPIPPW